MKYYLLILLLLLFTLTLTGVANTQYPGELFMLTKYRWPLDINNGYSSSFQEFRSTHFHAGMDFRTFQKTGYPVYAIADGHIYKIRMVKRDSGRGLYLKHDDGNSSIYFHLDKFEKNLEDLLKQVQQLKGQKYFGNYYLNKPLRFKQGQLIAYSGETGYGFPHLHLEIRDRHNFAINPFKLLKLPSQDSNPPVLKGLLLRNRNSSLINGTIGEHYIKFKKVRDNHYASAKPVIITGPFDVVLNASDISDCSRQVSPYEISVFIDENHYFHLRFDRFQWEDNNQLGFVYDMFHSNSSSYFFNLFSQKGFSLESKNMPLPHIIDTIDYGEHQLKIQVTDNYNNVSTGLVTFYKIKKPVLQLAKCFVKEGEINLEVEKLEAESADEITLSLKERDENTIYSGRLKDRTISQKKGFFLKGSFEKICFVDFSFLKEGMTYFRKRFLLKDQWLTGITDIAFDTFINQDDVFIKVSKSNQGLSSDNLRLTVIQGGDSKVIEAESSSDSIYFCFKPLNFSNKVLLHFSILKDNQKVVIIQKKLWLIYLIKGLKQNFKYEEFGAEFDKKSVYEPKVMQMEEKNYSSAFPVLSRQISLAPYYFPFLDRVYYIFRKDLPNPRQVGIFKYDFKHHRWYYQHTTYDSASKTYKRKVLSSGTYALMRDIYFPQISFKSPRTKYIKYLKRLVVTITDKGKGVNDNTLKVQLNGKPVDCEYDPDWQHVVIEDLRHVIVGKNLLNVVVRDYGGNRSTRTFSFYLR
jgi:hypothetical protein